MHRRRSRPRETKVSRAVFPGLVFLVSLLLLLLLLVMMIIIKRSGRSKGRRREWPSRMRCSSSTVKRIRTRRRRRGYRWPLGMMRRPIVVGLKCPRGAERVLQNGEHGHFFRVDRAIKRPDGRKDSRLRHSLPIRTDDDDGGARPRARGENGAS